MKFIYSIAVIAMISFVLSCNVNNEAPDKATTADIPELNRQQGLSIDKEAGTYTADSADGEPQLPGDKKKQQPPPSQQPVKTEWDKKIIKTATLNAEVSNYNSFYASLREKVKNMGGYIAREEQSQSDYKIENTISIKVPVDQFDNAVAQLTANTQKINEKKITSQDVTTTIIDTKARLEAKKQVRFRYMDLMSQAKNMTEILNVQSEINAIQEEIESAAGQIAYLGHSSVFSTINYTYYQVLNAMVQDKGTPSFATRISNAFKSGRDWFGELFVGIVSVWPLCLLLLAGFIYYKKIWVQKQHKAG